MKPIKKYLNKKGGGRLGSKLASYGAIAAAFMATSPEAHSQCAAVGAPLDIDIDGDGTADVTLNVVSGALYDPPPNSVSNPFTGFNYNPIGSVYVLTTIGPVVSSLYTAGGALGCAATLTAPFQVYANLISSATVAVTYLYSNLNINGSYQLAYAAVPSGNQILGTTAGSSNCPAATGTASAFLNYGYNGSTSFQGFLYQLIRTDLTYSIFASSVGATNPNGCLTAPGGLSFAGYAGLQIGPTYAITNSSSTYIAPYTAGPNPISGNIAGATQLAVQFAVGAQNHNGWVQITQNADGTVCVAATGFNSCSIENAVTNGNPDDACIAVGAADPKAGAGCPVEEVADVPTVGEWGLIILGLMMSITAIVGIRQRREEEVVA